jgi:hypothetical protein
VKNEEWRTAERVNLPNHPLSREFTKPPLPHQRVYQKGVPKEWFTNLFPIDLAYHIFFGF